MSEAFDTVYFSVDVESNGPIPGYHSMLSFGAAAFVEGWPDCKHTFTRNLEVDPGEFSDPETMKWWSEAENVLAYEACTRDPVPRKIAMQEFLSWVDTVSELYQANPVFVAYPAGYDFTFMYWYMIRYANRSPFGFSALDIKSFASGILGLAYRESVKRNFPKRWLSNRPHTHVALDDAIGQGEMFMRMLAESRLKSEAMP
jgi:hypothetical protein